MATPELTVPLSQVGDSMRLSLPSDSSRSEPDCRWRWTQPPKILEALSLPLDRQWSTQPNRQSLADLDLEFDPSTSTSTSTSDLPKSITTDVAFERRQAWDLGYGVCRPNTT